MIFFPVGLRNFWPINWTSFQAVYSAGARSKIYSNSYSQEGYKYVSGRDNIFLPSPAVYALVAMQPSSALQLYWGKKARIFHGRGFTSRWLPYVNLSTTAPGTINYFADACMSVQGTENKKWSLRTKELYETFYTTNPLAQKYYIQLASEGLQHLLNFRNGLGQTDLGELPDMKPWLSKLHGQAARLALGIHLWNYGAEAINHQITVEEIDAGICIAQKLIPHAHYLFSPTGMLGRVNAKKIAESLQRIKDYTQRDSILSTGLTTTQLHVKAPI